MNKPRLHMIYGGYWTRLPKVDTRGLPIEICPVVDFKPGWRFEPGSSATYVAQKAFDEMSHISEALKKDHVFVRGFANDLARGGDGVFTESERMYWEAVAERFVWIIRNEIHIGASGGLGRKLPRTIVFDHVQYFNRRDPEEKEWVEHVLLKPLRAMGITCGIYGGHSGFTHWAPPEKQVYDQPVEYQDVDIPWFIMPYQWRQQGGVVTPEEYRSSMQWALKIGYPSGIWAHWCEADKMSDTDWERAVDEIARIHESGVLPVEPPVDPDPEPVLPDPFEISPAEERLVEAFRQWFDERYDEWQR